MRLKVQENIEDKFDKQCDKCGKLLSDNGECPYCDHGEEDFEEGFGESLEEGINKDKLLDKLYSKFARQKYDRTWGRPIGYDKRTTKGIDSLVSQILDSSGNLDENKLDSLLGKLNKTYEKLNDEYRKWYDVNLSGSNYGNAPDVLHRTNQKMSNNLDKVFDQIKMLEYIKEVIKEFDDKEGKVSREDSNVISLHESYDDSLYVDIDEIIGTLGRALDEGMDHNPDVFSEVADIYGRLVEMRDAGYQLSASQNESLKSRLTEGPTDKDYMSYSEVISSLKEWADDDDELELTAEYVIFNSEGDPDRGGILFKDADPSEIINYLRSNAKELQQATCYYIDGYDAYYIETETETIGIAEDLRSLHLSQ